jgi:hypothetical protein
VPPGEIHKYILKRGMMSREAGQRAAFLLDVADQERQRLVQLLDRK